MVHNVERTDHVTSMVELVDSELSRLWDMCKRSIEYEEVLPRQAAEEINLLQRNWARLLQAVEALKSGSCPP